VHVHGDVHAAVRAAAGFHVLTMPEPAPGIRAVFWQPPVPVRNKRSSRSRSVIGLRRARAHKAACVISAAQQGRLQEAQNWAI
jgi:hypothetical protein